MQLFKTMVWGLCLLFGLWRHVPAQDTRLAEQALQCSVIMHLLGQSGLDKGQAPRWQHASTLMADVYRQASTGVAWHDAHAHVLAQIQSERKRQVAGMLESVVLCGAWAEGFLQQGESVRYVPVYPKVIAPLVRSLYAETARQWLGLH